MPRRARDPEATLTRRERQAMDVIHRLGSATARDLQVHLPDAPGYSAVRSVLRALETKGRLKHHRRGSAHVYSPVERPSRTRQSAVRRMLRTLFEGRPESLVSTLVDLEGTRLADEDYDRLIDIIETARREKRDGEDRA